MSLLLEALKKAEKAKEEAQRRARSSEDAAPADADATVLDEGRHVMTRDELPDISAPLEILSDDLRAAEPSRQPLDLDRLPAPAPAPAPEPAPTRREPARPPASSVNPDDRPAAAAPATASAERAAAKKVFEAKFREPNPKLPFYITMAVLGMACVGTGVYFYLQLRPPPPLVNTNPQRPKEEKPVVADTPAALPKAAPTPSTPAAIPGLPDTPGAPATNVPPAPSAAPPAAAAQAPATPVVPVPPAKPAAPAASSVPAQAAPAAPAKPEPAQATAAKPSAPTRADGAKATPSGGTPRGTARGTPAQPKGEEQALSVNRGGPQVHPQVTTGYAAYQAGDLARARNDYLQALRDEPTNRDALLGIAAVEMRAQRYDLADGYYARLLQIDPRDPHAQAGMLALRGQQLDPVAVESRVKSMLAANPDAIALHFTLGNQYAQQGRWAEAQQAYFRAFASDPENADIAYNLAVSLDQLNQPKPALEYYRRALSLAERRGASFPTELARARAQQLSR